MASKTKPVVQPIDEPKWTNEFMETFAREWLKHKILLPNQDLEGISLKQLKTRKCVERREMYEALGISQYRHWTNTFMKQYKRWLTKKLIAVRANTLDQALEALPPWVREFEKHFNEIPKVLEDIATARKKAPPLNELLINILRVMWKELRDNGIEGHKLEFWTRAIRAASEECKHPCQLVRKTWQSAMTVAMQKLRLLQAIGDRPPRGCSNNLTLADWLAVDLLLAVEPTETLLDQDSLTDYDQLATLTTLFSLAQMYQLDECLLGTAVDCQIRWKEATQVYLYRGMTTSTLVLQRRWYELVQLSRDALAGFRRGTGTVPPLCKQLAIRFPKLVTSHIPTWTELVISKRVVLPDYADLDAQHTPGVLAANQPPRHVESPNDDDIILIEKDIETIDLDGLDTDDEEKLLIDERIKIDKMRLEQRMRLIKEEINMKKLKREHLKQNKQDMCTQLDAELDSKLKYINENQDRQSTSNNVQPSIDGNLNKNAERLNTKFFGNCTQIDLTESDSTDGLSIFENTVVDTMKMDIDITEHNILESGCIIEPEVSNKIDKVNDKNNDSNIINRFEIETTNSQNIARNVEAPVTKSTISNLNVFEELDPSNVEAKIIFSDDEDECNNVASINPSNNDKVENDINQETAIRGTQNEITKNVKTDDISNAISKNEITPRPDAQIQQTDSILITDSESSDFDMVSTKIKTENANAQKSKEIDIQNKILIDSLLNESNDISKPTLPKKKRMGPKSFMKKCQEEEINKKRLEKPESFTDNLFEKLLTVSENNRSIPAESIVVKSTKGTSVICKKEINSDEEDSNLVIDENTDHTDIKKESNVDKTSRISLCFEENVADTVINKELSPSITTISDETKDIDTDVNKSKYIKKPSFTRFSFENENTEIEDRKPIIPMDTDEAIDVENSENVSKTSGEHSQITGSKVEGTVSNTRDEIADSPMDCQSEKDKNDNLNPRFALERNLLKPVQIPLYKIDEFTFWKKHASENTIDVSKINKYLNPVKPRSQSGLKLGFGPTGLLGRKPVKRLARCYNSSELKNNPDFNFSLNRLDVNFILKNADCLANVCRPVTVDIVRLPVHVIEDHLVKQGLDALLRPRKKVELADLDEVRRINKRLLTAQVRPIVAMQSLEPTQKDELVIESSDAESDVSFVMDIEPAPLNPSADTHDNTLTCQELDEVLKKLTTKEMYAKQFAKPNKHCCPARRHINYNRARARIAARAGRKPMVIDLHAKSGKAHAELKCECCCLDALRGMKLNKMKLANDLKALYRELKNLAQVKNNEGSKAATTTPTNSTNPKDPGSDEDDDNLPLEKRKNKEKRGVKRKRKKKSKEDQNENEDKEKDTIGDKKTAEEEKKLRQEEEYEEWMRQRNICAKYFTIDPSGSNTNTTAKRSKSSVTSKRSEHTTGVIDQNLNPPKDNIPSLESKLTIGIAPLLTYNNALANKNLDNVITAQQIMDILAKRDTNMPNAVVEHIENHEEFKTVATPHIMEKNDVVDTVVVPHNTENNVINTAPVLDSIKEDGTVKAVNNIIEINTTIDTVVVPDNIDKNISEENKQENTELKTNTNLIVPDHTYMKLPPVAIPIHVPNTKLTIVPMTSQHYDIADEDPMTIILPDKQPSSESTVSAKSGDTTTELTEGTLVRPDGFSGDEVHRYIIKNPPVANTQGGQKQNNMPSLVETQDTQKKYNIPQLVVGHSPTYGTKLILQPYVLDPPTQQNQILTQNPTQAPSNQVQANPVQLTSSVSEQTEQSTNQTQSIKQHIVTHVSGKPDSPASQYWNNAITQPQIKALIETAQANPGLKFMKVLQSPNHSETVLATCIAKKDDPNQTTLRLITQKSSSQKVTAAKTPSISEPAFIDLTENEPTAPTSMHSQLNSQSVNQPVQSVSQVTPYQSTHITGQANLEIEPLNTSQTNQLVKPLRKTVQNMENKIAQPLNRLVQTKENILNKPAQTKGEQISKQIGKLDHLIVNKISEPLNKTLQPIELDKIAQTTGNQIVQPSNRPTQTTGNQLVQSLKIPAQTTGNQIVQPSNRPTQTNQLVQPLNIPAQTKRNLIVQPLKVRALTKGRIVQPLKVPGQTTENQIVQSLNKPAHTKGIQIENAIVTDRTNRPLIRRTQTTGNQIAQSLKISAQTTANQIVQPSNRPTQTTANQLVQPLNKPTQNVILMSQTMQPIITPSQTLVQTGQITQQLNGPVQTVGQANPMVQMISPPEMIQMHKPIPGQPIELLIQVNPKPNPVAFMPTHLTFQPVKSQVVQLTDQHTQQKRVINVHYSNNAKVAVPSEKTTKKPNQIILNNYLDSSSSKKKTLPPWIKNSNQTVLNKHVKDVNTENSGKTDDVKQIQHDPVKDNESFTGRSLPIISDIVGNYKSTTENPDKSDGNIDMQKSEKPMTPESHKSLKAITESFLYKSRTYLRNKNVYSESLLATEVREEIQEDLSHVRKKKFQSTDLSDAPPLYVNDIVKFILASKMPLSEVRILCVHTQRPLLKLRNRFIVVSEAVGVNRNLPSFWTLNPLLDFNQIYFSRYGKSPKKVKALNIQEELKKEKARRNLNAEGNDNTRLRVKSFAKLSDSEIDALEERVEAQTQDIPLGKLLVKAEDFMYIDNKCFKKLIDDPLIYAQVFSARSELILIEDIAVEDSPLYLLDVVERRLMPIQRRDTTNGRQFTINLVCPGANEAMQDLVKMMNSPRDEFGLPRAVKQYVVFTSDDKLADDFTPGNNPCASDNDPCVSGSDPCASDSTSDSDIKDVTPVNNDVIQLSDDEST